MNLSSDSLARLALIVIAGLVVIAGLIVVVNYVDVPAIGNTPFQNWPFKPRQPVVLYLVSSDDAAYDLWAISLDGRNPREVFHADYGIDDFSPGPDGSQIAMSIYSENLSADIWITGATGSQPRQITDCSPGFCSSPAWSPDGRLLAYARHDPASGGVPGTSRIWLYDLESEQTTSVFDDDQVSGSGPIWSVNGSRLAFFDASAGVIRVLDLSNNSSLAHIRSLMGETGSFSPDGDMLVYSDIRQVGRQYFPQLWLAQLSSEGRIVPLLEQSEEDQSPVWSPDGEWIAFGRRRLDRQGGMGFQLMLFNPATGELRQITDDPDYNNTGFRWEPAGRFILMQRFALTGAYAGPELWVYNLETDHLVRLVVGGVGAQWLP